MRRIKTGFLWIVILAVLGVSSAYADPILSVTLSPPSGAISGAPGTVVGWGFTLTNPDSLFAVITGADFCGAVITSPCSTPLGTFTDFIAQFNFTIVDPFSTLPVDFDPVALTGIGSYLIDSGASFGDSFIG